MKKIAIHHRSGSFSDRWIAYCEKKNIPYKIVNAFDTDIINQLKDCNAFMWHHNHGIYKDTIVAKKILFALEHAGIKVFPNFKTGWHFDDKVAQKYLFEALDVPLVPSYIFYDKQEAIAWAKETDYPKVFKLKGGAGALNVRLIKSKREAIKLINKAFGKGFLSYNNFALLKDHIKKFKAGQEPFSYVLRGLARTYKVMAFTRKQPREKGYVYFQNFIANNTSDLRVIVVGDKAFSIKRFVRKNDFRASGSGTFDFDRKNIDERCIKLAFEINEKLNSQSIAYDFIWDTSGKPLLVEISYGFAIEAYDNCPGYWDKSLTWHQQNFNPQEWMVDELIKKL